jgi:hypothetical protein
VYKARGAFRRIRAAAGFDATAMSVPFLIDGTRSVHQDPAAERFGASTRSTLQALAGMDGEQVQALIDRGAAVDHMTQTQHQSILPLEAWVELGAVRFVPRQPAEE